MSVIELCWVNVGGPGRSLTGNRWFGGSVGRFAAETNPRERQWQSTSTNAHKDASAAWRCRDQGNPWSCIATAGSHATARGGK